MAVDVIIDPLTGQIYWNDSQGTAQSIAISGNGTDLIKTVGYSLQFTAAPAGTITSGSATTAVTGSGTNFLTLFGSGSAGAGAVLYTSQGTSIGTVSTVSTDTALTLSANASGTYTGITFRYSPPTGTDRLVFSDSATPIYPATTGANLGTSSYRWSLYASYGDITNTGTTSINLMLDKSGIGSTESPALQFINTTAATSGAQYQFAPWSEFRGKAWNTTSSASNDIRMRVGMAALSGTAPTSEFVIASSVDTGTASWYYPLTLNSTANDSVMYLNNGVLSIGKLLTSGTTSSYALELYNYNLATSGQTANWSPAFEMNGSAWNTSTATSNILRFRSEVQTTSGNPITGSIVWKSAVATSYSATPSFSNNLSLSNTNGLGLWNANTAASYLKASGSQASDIVYTFPSSAPTANQVLSASSVSGSSITLTWATASGSGTVNSGASGKVAYYPSAGTTVDDATALDYSTTSPHLSITAQATTAIPLKLIGIASQSVDLFQVATSGANVVTVSSTGIVTMSNSTASGATTSGALVVSGGIGAGSTSYLSDLYVTGTNLIATSATTVTLGTTASGTVTIQNPTLTFSGTTLNESAVTTYNLSTTPTGAVTLNIGTGVTASATKAINIGTGAATTATTTITIGTTAGTSTINLNAPTIDNASSSVTLYATPATVTEFGGATTLTISNTTATSTVNIATGNNAGNAKTINIGTGGTGAGAVNITFGISTGTATTNSATIAFPNATSITGTSGSLTAFGAVTTATLFGAATSMTLGSSTGTGSIQNTTVSFPNATVISGSSALATVFSAANPASLAVFGSATTATLFGAATSMTLGAATGTASIQNTTVSFPNATVISGSSGLATVFSAANPASLAVFGSATTATIFGSATSLTIGGSTGTASIQNTTVSFPNATVISGSSGLATVFSAANPASLAVFGSATTATIFGAATTLTIGGSTGTATIQNTTVSFSNATVISGSSGLATVFSAANPASLAVFGAATTATIFASATSLSLGASTGTATIANTTVTLSNATNLNESAVTTYNLSTTPTGAVTLNIGTGAVTSATKTINIGTGGNTGGTTTINIGTTSGTSTLTINSTTATFAANAAIIAASTTGTLTLFNTNVSAVNAYGAVTTYTLGTSSGTFTIASGGATTVALFNTATATTATAFTSATSLTLGATSGTGSIQNTTVSFPNATIISGSSGLATVFSAANPASLSVFAAATTITLGSSTGTASVNNTTISFPNATVISGSSGLATVFSAANPASLAIFGSATTATILGAATTLTIGGSTGTATIQNTTVSFSNATVISGSSGLATVFSAANPASLAVFGSATTATLLGAATTLTLGGSTGTATIQNTTVSFSNATVISGSSGLATVFSAANPASLAVFGSATTATILGAATSLTVGGTTGTATIRNTTITFTNATNFTGTTGSITLFAEATSVTALGAATSFTLAGTTASSTINIGNGTLASGATRTINIGASGVATSTTLITIGTTANTSNSTISFSGNRLQNVADPTAAQDAATKSYVDAVKTGLDVHAAARVVEINQIAGNYVQANAAGSTSSGVATITYTSTGTTTIDGKALVASDRVLVTNGISGTVTANSVAITNTSDPNKYTANGAYTVTTAGTTGVATVLTRATDLDDNLELEGGTFLFVQEGTSYADSGWVCTNDTITTPITFAPSTGTSGVITFVQFSGAGQITAGTGLSKSGNTISISTTYAGQTSITTLGTVTTGTWNASTLAVGYGGTGTSTAPTQWGVIFATSTSQYASTAAGTNNQWLRAVTSGAPTWSTATLATTFAVGDLVYAGTANALSGLASTATSVLITQGAAAPSWLQGATGNRLLKTSGSAISWSQVDLTADVTGTLPLANGGLGTSTFTQNGVLYGNLATSVLVTAASGAAGAILQTTASGGAPSFSTSLPGTYSFSSSTAATSTTSAAVVFSGGIGVGSTSYFNDLYTIGTILSSTSATTVNISTSPTGAATLNIGTGAVTSATKTINIGTGGNTGGTTAITIGTTSGTSSIALNATTVTLGGTTLTASSLTSTTLGTTASGTATLQNPNVNLGTTAAAGTVAALSSTFTANNATTVSATSATSISFGANTGTFTIGNTTVTLTNATNLNQSAITTYNLSTTPTGAVTLNIGTGAVTSATKTINIGTGAASGGTTAIVIGTTTGTSTIALNGITTLSSALAVGSGGTGLTTLTAGYIPYGNGSNAFGSTSSFYYDTSLSVLNATIFKSTNSQVDEGGEIQLALPSSGSTLTTSVTIDVYQNKLRIFETGGTNRGAYIDLTSAGAGVASNLLGSGGSGSVGSGTTGQIAYYAGATTTASAAGLVYSSATTTSHLTITAQAVGNNPLKLVGATSQTADLFTVATSGGTVFNINSTGLINSGTWNGTTIAVGYGGTGTSTAPTQWGVIFATSASQYNSTAAGSTNQWLRAVTSGAPTWSTATLATTFAVGDLVYAGTANSLSGLASTATSVLITQGTAAPSWLQGATSNRLLKTSGSAISWSQVDLTTDVTGTLPLANGGLGTTTFTQNGVLYGNAATSILVTAASGAVGAILQTTTSGGAPTFSNTLAGRYTFSYSPTTGTSTNNAFSITGVPFAEASGALIEIGAATAFDGSTANHFGTVASTNGTFHGIWAASGFSGNYAMWGQADGNGYRMAVSSTGMTVRSNSAYGFSIQNFANQNIFVVGSAKTGINITPSYPLDVRESEGGDTSTSTVLVVQNITRLTTGTAGAGIGAGIQFQLENSDASTVTAARIDASLTSVGATTYVGALSFNTNTAGSNTLVERARLDNTALTLYPVGTTAGSTLEVRFRELAANGTNVTTLKAPDSLAADIVYTLPSTGPSANQILAATAVSGTSVTLGWANDATGSGGSGTVGSGTATQLAYYSGTTTTASAAAMVYNAGASTSHLIITAQATTNTPLRLVGIASQNVNLLEIATSGANVVTVSSTGIVTLSNNTAASATNSGALVVTGGIGAGSTSYLSDLYVTGANLIATSATTLTLGAATGTASIQNTTVSFPNATVISGSSGLATVFSAANPASLAVFGSATTATIFGAATTLTIGGSTGTATIQNTTVSFSNATVISGSSGLATVFSAANPASLAVFGSATTATIFGAATTLSLGASTGTATIANTTVTLSNATNLNQSAVTTLNLSTTPTGAVTLNFGTGAVTSATKTINIGTGAASGGTTTINIGTTTGTSTIALNGTVTLSSALAVGSGGTGTSTAPTQWGIIFATSTSQYASTGASAAAGSLLHANSGAAPTLTTTLAGQYTMSPSAGTGTQNPVLTITSPAHTALTASTEHNSLNFNLSATVQFATGAITTLRAFRIQAPTYSFQGASTVTNAAALQIDSAPVAGTNATLTETAALRVLTGTTVGKGVVVRGAASQTGNLFEAQNSTPTTIWNISAAGNETISPAASTGTQSPELTITGPAHTALTASTEFNDVNFNFARTVQFATGAITTLRAFRIQAPTYGFQGASTVTNAATLQIDSAPIVGTNATLTESAALRVLTGADAAKGVVIRANSGTQSGNLFEVQNSTGTAQVAVSGAGSLVIGTASGALSASSGTVSVGTLSIGNGGTNTTSFATSNGVVYYDGTRLVTTNATASGILVTNASNVPSTATDIPTAVTIGGSYVYRAGGTDVALADGGTNASLTGVAGGVVYSTTSAMAITTAGSSGQPLLSGGTGAPSFGTLGMGAGGTGLTTTTPGANYILGMNASNNGLEYKQLVQGSNITITHAANSVTITASGGSATPGGSNTQIQYNNAGALGGISNFTFVSPLLSVTNATNFGTTSTAGLELKYSTAAGTTTVNNNSPAMDFIGRLYASASDRYARIREEIQTTAATPAHAMVWSSSYDTGTASYTKVLSLHSVDGLGFWNYAGTPGSFANYFKTGNQASDIRYTWPTTAPTANQVLNASAVSGADITLSWTTPSSGSGTVGSGTASQVAYYSGTTTTASAAAMVYSATGTHLTITAQGASTSPLKVVGAASQSASIFTVSTSGGDVLTVDSSGFTSITAMQDTGVTFQNSTTTTKKFKFDAASITAGNTRTLTIPDATTTLVGTDVTQTLTNKTLSAAVVPTSASITAAGTTAATATTITSDYNVVTTSTNTSDPFNGVILPAATTGRQVIIVNRSSNPINVYPQAGGTTIDGTTDPELLSTNSPHIFEAASTTSWFVVGSSHRPLTLTFCSGYTPATTGADSVVLRLPESPDGGANTVWYVPRKLNVRVETPSSGTSTIQVEYYTGTSAFSATNLLSSAVSVTGATTYEFSSTGFSTTTLSSNTKLRLNFTGLNATHANFFVQLLLEER